MFFDGLSDMWNQLTNSRNTLNSSYHAQNKILPNGELTAIYETGLGHRIARIKSTYTTYSTNFVFDKEQETVFEKYRQKIKEAVQWAIVFGRGIIVLYTGNKLDEPRKGNIQRVEVFSGDVVGVSSVSTDLSSDRYNKPLYYTVNGHTIHHTNVIDFVYYTPTATRLPEFNYGGMSEFQIISDQLKQDGVISRASANIIEKSSSIFYKVKGFKNLLAQKQEDALVEYFSIVENKRNMYGAGVIDVEDEVTELKQTLTHLAEVNDNSLRRIALATGIPLPILVGESVKGLNSSGTQERTTFYDTLLGIEEDIILPKINELFIAFGLSETYINKNQNTTPLEKVEYESKVIDNANKLNALGIDAGGYLTENNIVYQDDLVEFEIEV